ncbi:unnamed protein product [Cylicocyclus nassatus]|uniref:Uncharacterized protein n=1 Tax=Cylicocyclus nassatus TaxID=53992 RepID=A0AA36DNF4_CYLNA|nr:unnamed protein product [Cylicocyclus nassatus]
MIYNSSQKATDTEYRFLVSKKNVVEPAGCHVFNKLLETSVLIMVTMTEPRLFCQRLRKSVSPLKASKAALSLRN